MKRAARILVPLFALLALGSCQQLFTTSLGAWAARDLSIPADLSAADTLDYAGQAVGNGDAELAEALLPALVENIDEPGVLEAAADVLVFATGADGAIDEATLVLLEVMESGVAPTQDQIDEITAAIAAIAVSADAMTIMQAMAADPSSLTPDQLALAGIILIASIADDAVIADALANDDPSAIDAAVTGDPAYDTAYALVAAAAAAAPGDGSSIADLLANFIGSMPTPT
ncbi:MAG: hypothetical protein JXA15_02730 [Spirochaetales bacterium]|nr:hypothetical protein [Spirochaetales bacterium]